MLDQEQIQNFNQKVKEIVGLSLKFPDKDELVFLERQPATKSLVKQTNVKLVDLMGQISKLVMGKQTINKDSLTVPFQSIELVMDELMEKVGLALDKQEYGGDNDDGFQEVQVRMRKTNTQDESQQHQTLKPADIYEFKDSIQMNLGIYPFIPVIKNKMFSQIPIHPDIISAQKDQESFFKQIEIQGYTLHGFEFPHPYQQEIEAIEPSSHMIDPNETIKSFTALGQAVIVKDLNTLRQMVESILELVKVEGQTEIAVDLEHHHQHSYLGITCLIQITTRNQIDYIIDPFPLWKHLGEELASIFHNEKVLKVLHGADSDVQWLQRDFGLYLVNMFDTFNACKSLMFPACSYAYLLEYYCKKNTDKKYQLADWSIRPIQSEMLKYAQMDTHYLLYIYDRLRIDLYNLAIQRNVQPTCSFIISSFQKSKDTSLKVYRKPLQNSNLVLDGILFRAQKTLDPKRYFLTTQLLELREQISRENDENINSVLPNYQLFKLVDVRPTKLSEIYSVTGGERSTHPLIKKHYNLITRIFLSDMFEEAKQTDIQQQPQIVAVKKPQQQESIIFTQEPIIQNSSIKEFFFQFQPIQIIMNSYKSNEKTVRDDQNTKIEQQYQQIKQQFSFNDSIQCFKNTQVVQHILNQLNVSGEIQSGMVDNLNNKEQIIPLEKTITDDYIAFPMMEKGEQPQIKANQFKLFEPEEPQSLKQQFGVKMVKRRKFRGQEENSVIKKQIQKNANYNIFEKLS